MHFKINIKEFSVQYNFNIKHITCTNLTLFSIKRIL